MRMINYWELPSGAKVDFEKGVATLPTGEQVKIENNIQNGIYIGLTRPDMLMKSLKADDTIYEIANICDDIFKQYQGTHNQIFIKFNKTLLNYNRALSTEMNKCEG